MSGDTNATTTKSVELNQMVVGLTGKAGAIENKLITALMLYKTTANELEKQVNANSVAYGVNQGTAEYDFYHSQATSDLNSGGMIIGQAGSEFAAVGLGEYQAGKATVEEGTPGKAALTLDADSKAQNAKIAECDMKESNFKTRSNEVSIKKDGAPASAEAKEQDALTEKQNDAALEKNAQERKDAQKQVRRNSERRSSIAQQYQRGGDMAGKVFQATDKFQSSTQSVEQGKHKQFEVANQMANQINQNVQKGFETQKDTAASEVSSTISTYGAQGLGQANLHRPV